MKIDRGQLDAEDQGQKRESRNGKNTHPARHMMSRCERSFV